MGVIGLQKNAVAGHSDAAVDSGIANHSRRAGQLVMPELAAGPRIQRETLVGGGHVHDAVHDHRRHFQPSRARNRSHPLRCQPGDIVLVDLRQRGVAVAAGIAIVGWPVRLGSDLSKEISSAAQQMDALIIGLQLQVLETFAEHLPTQSLAVDRLNGHVHNRPLQCALLNRAQEPQQISHLRIGDLAWRHPSRGQALPNECGKLPSFAASQAGGNRGAHRASVAVGAMACRAAIFK